MILKNPEIYVSVINKHIQDGSIYWVALNPRLGGPYVYYRYIPIAVDWHRNYLLVISKRVNINDDQNL